MVCDKPISMKSIPTVATTGCNLTTATRIPLIMPTIVARINRIGTEKYQEPSPAGISTAMKMTLMKVVRGPTEMSIPPERTDGVEAKPTSANGAKVPKMAGHRVGFEKLGETIIFRASNTMHSSSANA